MPKPLPGSGEFRTDKTGIQRMRYLTEIHANYNALNKDFWTIAGTLIGEKYVAGYR